MLERDSILTVCLIISSGIGRQGCLECLAGVVLERDSILTVCLITSSGIGRQRLFRVSSRSCVGERF